MLTGRGKLAASPLALAVLLLAVLALGACGGDSEDGGDSAEAVERVSLRLTQPTDGATVDGDSVDVAGTVTPGASVDVNRRPAEVTEGAFRATVAGLDEGSSTIAVRAAKPGMQPAEVSVTVTRADAGAAQARADRGKASGEGEPGGERDERAGSGQASSDSGSGASSPKPARARKPRSVQARLRAHLRRFDDESWYRSITRVTVAKGAAMIWTRLRFGTANAKRQAGRICRAVRSFRLPKSITLVLVNGSPAGVIVRYCTVPGRQPKRL